METGTRSGRVRSLVVELGARTAILDGRRVELPPTEFSLLAVLASRPGEVVPHKRLLTEAFGDDSYMTTTDLHWRFWNIRKLIGDSERRLIRNRRSMGFVLELPPAAVEIVEGVAAPDVGETEVIRLDEPDSAAVLAATDDDEVIDGDTAPREAPSKSANRPRLRLRAKSLALIAAIAVALPAISYGLGYSLARINASGSEADNEAQAPPEKTEQKGAQDPPTAQERQRRERSGREGKPSKQSGRAQGSQLAETSDPSSGGGAENAEVPAQSSKKGSGNQTSKPSLPPAPTRYLYHLVNADSGDHFVTTDGKVASTYEGRGYSGGAIARIYTSKEQGTKAIATNRGTAYVFIDASPETDPPSETTALWFATDNAGDFFYTTSRREAMQEGWRATVIGYVRTL